VTAKGRRYLAETWHTLLESPPPSDIDATLRIGALALLSGAKHGQVARFLRDASKQRTGSEFAEKAEQMTLMADSAGGYRWMRLPTKTRWPVCRRSAAN
jgi:hypothetical protein